jgi:CubicO group peptidase (beta-lactamase class C family)
MEIAMKRLGRFALLCTALFTPAFAGTAQAPATPELAPELRALAERLDRQAASEFAKDGLGSLTVGLVSDAGLVWTRSYGLADMEKKVPATSDTVYRIGSVTKQFTALMLLQLAQDGKVHLSDPVEKYFPEVNKVQGRLPGTPPITLIQLATHTSGLDREPEDTETYLKGPVADWEKVLIAALPHTRYAYEPGTRFSYSNAGYAILGAALGRAAGRPYVEYVRERIFKPLGMSHSFFEPDGQTRSRIAKGYLSEDGKVESETSEREHQGRGYKVPNGAIYTTVGDMARFVAFELGAEAEPVLKKESLEESFESLLTANPGFTRGYGTGFQVLRLGDTVVHGHNGGVAGYQAEAFFDRGSRIGVVILKSSLGGPFDTSPLLRAVFEKGK